MKYERLTKWETSKGVRCVKYWQYSQEQIAERLALLEDKIERGELVDVKENHLIAISRGSGKSSKQLKAIEILTKYENGTMIELPCKVGDTVYMIWIDRLDENNMPIHKIQSGNIFAIQLENKEGELDIWLRVEFGLTYCCRRIKDFYLTKAEAEAKLKELL